MPFTVEKVESDGKHRWGVVHCACDLANPSDKLLEKMITVVRDAYGEGELVEFLEADASVAARFDVSAIVAALRQGMPDPAGEGKKPAPLRNVRSETAELLAEEVLSHVYGIAFPARAQESKGNANQPVLGFDGWGLLASQGGMSLVLLSVKASDDAQRPPAITDVIADECKRMPKEPDKLCRALGALQALLKRKPEVRTEIVRMLERLGKGELPELVVAPVLVRGNTKADLADLATLRARTGDYDPPAVACGAVVSVGASLDNFGTAVMDTARAA